MKPELPHDRKLLQISIPARYTFVLLWTVADDEGYFRADLRWLWGALYGGDENVSEQDLRGWLKELTHIEVIRWRKKPDGTPIGHITNWAKHQRIDRPSRSFLKRDLEKATTPDDRYCYGLKRARDGAIKIGCSRDPSRRMVEISVSERDEIRFLGCSGDGFALERQASSDLASQVISGEWYTGSPTTMEWVQAHLTQALPPTIAYSAHRRREDVDSDSRVTRESSAHRSLESLSLESLVLSPESRSPKDNTSVTSQKSENGPLLEVEDSSTRRQTREKALLLAAETVFRYWRARMGKTGRVIFDRTRMARIQARLRENGGDVSELLYAIDGALKDEFLMGRDPDAKRRHDGIETILRDRPQVERLVSLVPARTPGHPFISRPAEPEADSV